MCGEYCAMALVEKYLRRPLAKQQTCW